MSKRVPLPPAAPADSSRRRSIAGVVIALASFAVTSALLAQKPSVQPASDATIFGTTRDVVGIDQAAAERIFAASEAAIYFPELGRVRSFDAADASGRARDGVAESLEAYRDRLEIDFPGLRANAFGPWLMKTPAISRSVASPSANAGAAPNAAAFSDSFESGLVNWDTSNNTLDLYDWGTTTCEARSGARSADAVRGGVNALSCSDTYASNVETTMVHNACEVITAANEAWLDLWIHVATESGYDTLGLYYAGSDQRYGYAFSGTWSAWFHVVFNLKQWYRVGDVTASTCPNLMIQFESDSDTETGIGARIDDLTISTSAPSFLSCSITATPASGGAPLAVSFTPVVTGASGSTVYLWSFGDAAGTTAATTTASFTYTEPGDYHARLRVENQGIRAYAHKTIHVTSASSCSLSCAALAPASAIAGSPVPFQSTATASGCSEGPVFSWTFGDGQSSTQQNPSNTYSASGTYSWTLTTSASGQSCTRTGSITVSSSGAKPRRHPVRRSDDTVATATIGTSGGTLSGGGFKLTVPAGAFSANANLTLSRTATPQPTRGDVSDRFRLSGLPNTMAMDLTVEIELPTSAPPLASGKKYYITMDAPAYIDHDASVAPFRLPPAVNGRKLSVPLPKHWMTPSATAATDPEITPELEPLLNPEIQACMFATIETQHFTAFVSDDLSSSTAVILNLLESHFQKLEMLGFSFDCRVASGTFRKIEVSPRALGTGDTDPFGVHVSRSSPCGSGWIFNDYLQITTSYPSTDKRVDYAAGHELFHLLQDIYSPGGPRANLWLKEASSIWYELVLGNPCPDVQSANVAFPWNGLFNSKRSAVPPGEKPTDGEAHHGYGASYLFYRFAKSLTDSFVPDIWKSIKSGRNEFEAVESAFGGWSSLKSTWARFARDYFGGRMSEEGCPVSYSGAGEGFPKAVIANADALPKSFKIPVYPLSAKSWVLDLTSYSTTAPQAAALSTAGLISEQTAYVYDVKAHADLAELTRESPSHNIADLSALKGSVLVVVVVDRNSPLPPDPNVQSPTNEVTLTLEPQGGDATLKYSFVVPVLGCPYPEDHTLNAASYSPQPSMAVKWTGNSFTGSWSRNENGTQQEITITGTTAADRRTLTTMELRDHYLHLSPTGVRNERWITATLGPVPARADWKQTSYIFGPNCNAGSCQAARPMILSLFHRRLNSGYPPPYQDSNYDCTYTIEEARASEINLVIEVTPPATP